MAALSPVILALFLFNANNTNNYENLLKAILHSNHDCNGSDYKVTQLLDEGMLKQISGNVDTDVELAGISEQPGSIGTKLSTAFNMESTTSLDGMHETKDPLVTEGCNLAGTATPPVKESSNIKKPIALSGNLNVNVDSSTLNGLLETKVKEIDNLSMSLSSTTPIMHLSDYIFHRKKLSPQPGIPHTTQKPQRPHMKADDPGMLPTTTPSTPTPKQIPSILLNTIKPPTTTHGKKLPTPTAIPKTTNTTNTTTPSPTLLPHLKALNLTRTNTTRTPPLLDPHLSDTHTTSTTVKPKNDPKSDSVQEDDIPPPPQSDEARSSGPTPRPKSSSSSSIPAPAIKYEDSQSKSDNLSDEENYEKIIATSDDESKEYSSTLTTPILTSALYNHESMLPTHLPSTIAFDINTHKVVGDDHTNPWAGYTSNTRPLRRESSPIVNSDYTDSQNADYTDYEGWDDFFRFKGDDKISAEIHTTNHMDLLQNFLGDFTLTSKFDGTFETNQNVKPCVNFYDHIICGTSKSTDELPTDRLKLLLQAPVLANETNFEKLTKNYYQTCMDLRNRDNCSITHAREVIEILTGSVFDADVKSPNWKDVILKMNERGVPLYLFKLNIEFDHEDDDTPTINIMPADQIVSIKSLLQGFSNSKVDAYYELIKEIFMYFGAESSYAETESSNVINLEIAMAHIKLDFLLQNHDNDKGNVGLKSVLELQTMFPNFPWVNYLKINLGAEHAAIEYDSHMTQYMNLVFQLLDNTPNRTIINYLMWRMIYDNIDSLDYNIENFYHAYLAKIKKEPQSRMEKCMKFIETYLSPAASAIYIKNEMSKNMSKILLNLTESIQSAAYDFINKLNIPANDKALILQDMLTPKDNLHHIFKLMNVSALETFYHNITFNPINFLNASLEIRAFNRKLLIHSVFNPEFAQDWFDNDLLTKSQVTLADHDLKMVLPLAVLHKSKLNETTSAASIYGKLGKAVAHELLKHINYDKLTKATKDTLDKSANCMAFDHHVSTNKSYSSYFYDKFIDYISLKLSHDAFKDYQVKYGDNKTASRDMREFWFYGVREQCANLKVPDVTILNKDVINLPLLSSKEFLQDYKCDNKPKQKCA